MGESDLSIIFYEYTMNVKTGRHAQDAHSQYRCCWTGYAPEYPACLGPPCRPCSLLALPWPVIRTALDHVIRLIGGMSTSNSRIKLCRKYTPGCGDRRGEEAGSALRSCKQVKIRTWYRMFVPSAGNIVRAYRPDYTLQYLTITQDKHLKLPSPLDICMQRAGRHVRRNTVGDTCS